ncbi:MAG: transporter [Methylococcus sp.]|nr:MAG: transporter [Methylococcus sp.]
MNNPPSLFEWHRHSRGCLALFLFSASAWADTQPDILNPGPQLPTYPTNTGTLPQGRAYLEFAPFNYEGATGDDAGQYYTQFLAHIGATDSLELRVFGSGWTWSEGREDRTSFAPLSFSAVYGFWGEQEDYPWLPAFAVEAFVNTTWLGNSETRNGTHPGIQFAFSKDIPFDTNLNISLGPVRSRQDVGVNGNTDYREHWDFLFQWALQKDLIDNKLSIFAHGYYNGTAAVSVPVEGSGMTPDLFGIGKTVIGGGLIWTVTDRFSLFGQVSGGTNEDSPSMVTWSGFAVAF